jgi:hypothetical protein
MPALRYLLKTKTHCCNEPSFCVGMVDPTADPLIVLNTREVLRSALSKVGSSIGGAPQRRHHVRPQIRVVLQCHRGRLKGFERNFVIVGEAFEDGRKRGGVTQHAELVEGPETRAGAFRRQPRDTDRCESGPVWADGALERVAHAAHHLARIAEAHLVEHQPDADLELSVAHDRGERHQQIRALPGVVELPCAVRLVGSATNERSSASSSSSDRPLRSALICSISSFGLTTLTQTHRSSRTGKVDLIAATQILAAIGDTSRTSASSTTAP